jgi:hypothetical protein
MDQLTATHSGTDEKANENDTMNTAEKVLMGGNGRQGKKEEGGFDSKK